MKVITNLGLISTVEEARKKLEEIYNINLDNSKET